jgi:hypothetical protein
VLATASAFWACFVVLCGVTVASQQLAGVEEVVAIGGISAGLLACEIAIRRRTFVRFDRDAVILSRWWSQKTYTRDLIAYVDDRGLTMVMRANFPALRLVAVDGRSRWLEPTAEFRGDRRVDLADRITRWCATYEVPLELRRLGR